MPSPELGYLHLYVCNRTKFDESWGVLGTDDKNLKNYYSTKSYLTNMTYVNYDNFIKIIKNC